MAIDEKRNAMPGRPAPAERPAAPEMPAASGPAAPGSHVREGSGPRPMARFEHGGDIYSHPGAVDFSANVNPLGMPAATREALVQAVDSFEAYPDPNCRELTQALAAREGVPTDWVLCTAGATDLMTRACLALRPRTALVTAPCYSGYEQALTQIGADISRHILSGTNDFALTEEILGQVDGGIDLVFVASPNNPTGRTVDRHLLDVLLARAEEVGATVVLDECFIDFTTAGSAVAMAADHPNLLVMKAFTKIYAMAGLRLGYGICSNPDLMGRLRAAGQAWAVSTPAQVAGLAALGETGYLERTRTYVAGERERLRRGMTELGLRVVPGEANYLLFCSDYPLYQALLDCGVIIRRCQNYFGLTGGPGAMTLPDDVTRPAAGMGDYAVRPIPFWYRVAVRTHEQNDLLLAKLREVLP